MRRLGRPVGKMSKPNRKVVTSALALIPPNETAEGGSDLWPPIQKIREIHDKSFVRWMPHINLLYPFVPNNEFVDAVEKVKAAVSGVQPFSICYKDMSYFQHGARSFTMWLRPDPSEPVINLQKKLLEAFPFCSDLNDRSESGFMPHLSLGQWQNGPELQKKRLEFLSDWTPLNYQVDCVYLISRVGEEPFKVRYIIKFDGQVIPVDVVEEKTSPTKVFVGNLNFHTTQADLSGAFDALGMKVKTATVATDALGKPRGFGFVEFESADDAKRAIEQKDLSIRGRIVRISGAKE